MCLSFISFLQVWLAVLGIAALAALQHFPKKSISVMLHNPPKKKNDWRLAAATSGWKNTWFALIIHLRGLNQSQKCCSNVTWPLQLKVDAMRNVILRHSSIDSEFTVKQSKTCRAWVTVWPTANASGGGKKIGYCCLIQCTQEKYTPKTWSWYFIWTTTFWSLSVQSRVFFGGEGVEMCIFFQLKNIPWHSVNHFHQPAACLLCGL